MPTPSPLSLPETWNDVATGYSDELIPHFSLYAQDALRLAGLPRNARVLDVAAGPGTLTLLAAPDVEHVVAIDFAQGMIRELERRAAASGHTNVEVLQADGQALPFEDVCFDAVFNMFGLIFFPYRTAGFREARRVLKPGCRAVFSSWAPLDGAPLLRCCFEALGELLPSIPFGKGKAPLSDVSEFRAEMEGAGFRDVEIHTVTHSVEVPSVSAFWTSNARSSAPLVLVRKKLDAARWDGISARVVETLQREFGRGPIETRWPARLGVGVR